MRTDFIEAITRISALITASLALSQFVLSQAAFAQVNPSPMDIKGVKLGMTFVEAQAILESRGYIVKPIGNAVYNLTDNDGQKNIKHVIGESRQTLMAKKKEGNDVIHMSTSGHPDRDNIVVVARMLKYPDEGTKPTWETLANKVEEKYGKANEFGSSARKKHVIKDGKITYFRDPYIFYEWNSKGKKRSKLMRMANAENRDVHEQPVCSLTEKGIVPKFGKNLDFEGPVSRMHTAYNDTTVSTYNFVNDFIQHSNNASWSLGPSIITQELRFKNEGVVYYSDLCRNSFFIRGNIDPETFEIINATFTMMDHKTIKKDLEAMEEWTDIKREEMEEARAKKNKAIRAAAPDIDL